MDRLFPLNSGRRKLYELIQKSVKVMLVEGISAFVRKAAGKKEKRQNTKVENTLSPKQQLRHSAILVNEEVTTMDVMVSVVIPTKNAGREFRHLLNMVKNQLGIKEIEIIIVDSGSDDDTINNGLEFGAEIIEIPSEDFSHSGARNLGAEHSKGNYLLFLTQDALPSSNTWLFHMLVALKENDAVAASCIEYPRRDSDLFYRTLSWNHNRFLGLDDRYDLLLSKPELEDPVLWRKNAQLSDVACLIVKDVFEKYRFRSDYAEDLDLGVRLIRDGYRLVLLATNPVIHSHNRSPYYYLKRWYVETLALPKILPGYIVSDVDFDVLVHEIVALYNAVDGLKTRDLFPLNLPCKVRDIKGLATSFRNLITSGSSYHSPYVNKNSHDEKLMVFISNLYSLSSGKPLDNLDMDAFDAMLQSLSSIVNMVWDYIENSYELVDERLVEEFEQSIYKAFAILCGERLADCYQTVRDEFGQARDYIHEELLKGV
jgi:glycosyltransferase involved in cell wall biosynthesis